MCRNIKTLYNYEPPVNTAEIEAAALQYVRKVSGYTRPSLANEAAFETAVAQVAAATQALLDTLQTKAPPRSRDADAARARERAAARTSQEEPS